MVSALHRKNLTDFKFQYFSRSKLEFSRRVFMPQFRTHVSYVKMSIIDIGSANELRKIKSLFKAIFNGKTSLTHHTVRFVNEIVAKTVKSHI